MQGIGGWGHRFLDFFWANDTSYCVIFLVDSIKISARKERKYSVHSFQKKSGNNQFEIILFFFFLNVGLPRPPCLFHDTSNDSHHKPLCLSALSSKKNKTTPSIFTSAKILNFYDFFSSDKFCFFIAIQKTEKTNIHLIFDVTL